MKVARFTHGGSTRLGVVVDDEILDVGSAHSDLPNDVGDAIASGTLDDLEGLAGPAPRLPLEAVRLEAPIARPPVFLGVGLNYRAHASETRMEVPAAPVIFNKQITCVSGPSDAIVVPAAAPERLDYEGELGVVIGQRCRAVPADEARHVVAGYVVVNDVSVRDWQLASPTITMGKSWDTHGPTGPWLVTPEEVADPHRLHLRTWVDGEPRQDAWTSEMIHDCWHLIEHLSTAFTLLPGTIIATGTPSGVGFTMDPPRFLRAGSTVRIEIDGIGILENRVVDEEAVES